MNILAMEMKANLKSLIIWCVSMTLLIYAGMIKYSGFAGAGESAKELFDQFPPAVKSIMGLGELDISSISGFYAVFYLYFMVLAGIHAVMLGAVIISKEERDKTAEFLFVKPVMRSKIITSKLLAVLFNIIVLNLTTLTASIIFVDMYNTGEPINREIIILMISLFIIQLIFAALGAGIAAVSKNAKKAASWSAGILMTSFIVSVAIDIYNRIDFLKYLTPFKYFPAADIIRSGSYSPTFLTISLVIIIVFTITAYIYIDKRDIHI